MNINFLSNEPNNYSLDKIPVVTEVQKWITGDTLYRDVLHIFAKDIRNTQRA